jgi:hypothetical protein
MLAARELLNFVSSMVDEFEQGVRVAVPEATLQAQYIAIVWMLRAVGHVLYYWLRVFYLDRLEKSVERVNSRKRGVTRPFGNNLRSEPPSHC